MKRFVLLVLLFLLPGCSLERLFVANEIDKVYVVKYSNYVKHHRAYFSRESLRKLPNGKRYLFLYNAKKHDLSVLLRKEGKYLLYSFSKPGHTPIVYRNANSRSYRHALRYFARLGYRKTDLKARGYIVSTGLRRYKGVKTLMIDVKDYSRLKKRYLQAIDTYNARMVLSLRETLPASLIRDHLFSKYKQAKSEEQRAQLLRIAEKVGISIPNTTPLERTDVGESDHKSYYYYLYFAPTNELESYIAQVQENNTLDTKKIRALEARLWELQRKRLLEEGSLDELIKTYKQHKDQDIKKRIMELLREQQEKQSAGTEPA